MGHYQEEPILRDFLDNFPKEGWRSSDLDFSVKFAVQPGIVRRRGVRSDHVIKGTIDYISGGSHRSPDSKNADENFLFGIEVKIRTTALTTQQERESVEPILRPNTND